MFIPYEDIQILNPSIEVINKIKLLLSKESIQTEILNGLDKINSKNELIIFAVEFFSDKLCNKNVFLDVLSGLCLTYKGLSADEVCLLSKATSDEIQSILLIFKCFIVSYKIYFKITNSVFLKNFIEKYLSNENDQKRMHLQVAESLKGTSLCIRKLEETTNSYYLAGDFFQLKQTVSSIENFILLFNETIKFDLFKFWKRLEQKGYDPINEYNKSIELFNMHYNPKDEELFMINIQMTRFFKELSEFESDITPEFRRPLIKGKTIQDINSISTLKYKPPIQEETEDTIDLWNLNIFRPSPIFQGLQLNTGSLGELYKEYPILFDTKSEEISQPGLEIKRSNSNKVKAYRNFLEEIGLLQELKAVSMLDEPGQVQLKEHELLNIDIPLNKKKFKDYFDKILEERLSFKKRYNEKDQQQPMFVVEKAKINEGLQEPLLLFCNEDAQIDAYTKMILDIDLSIEGEQPRKFYYYKRWVWMNFPWICLSDEQVPYSQLIGFCYSDNNSLLDNQQEAIIYFKTLTFIIKCKAEKDILGDKLVNTSMVVSSNKSNFHVSKSSIRLMKGLSVKNDKFYVCSLGPKADESKLKTIYNKQDKSNFSTSKLSEVLSRGKKEEMGLIKASTRGMSDLVFGPALGPIEKLYQDRLAGVALLANKFNEKEVELLRSKNASILAELNKVRNQKEKIERDILLKNDQETYGKKMIDEPKHNEATKIAELQKELQSRKRQLHKIQRQKSRYQEIIDVCLINQTTNEERIKYLNHYLLNIKKLTTELDLEFEEQNKKYKMLRQLYKDTYSDYIKKEDKKTTFIKQFQETVQTKQKIDTELVTFDQDLIKNVNKNLSEMKGSMELQENRKTKINLKYSRQIYEQVTEKRLNELMDEYLKIRKLVSKKASLDSLEEVDVLNDLNENWHNSSDFLEFYKRVHVHRQLEASFLELQFKNEELEKQLKNNKSINIHNSLLNENQNKNATNKNLISNSNVSKNTSIEKIKQNTIRLSIQSLFNKIGLNIDMLSEKQLNQNDINDLESKLKIFLGVEGPNLRNKNENDISLDSSTNISVRKGKASKGLKM